MATVVKEEPEAPYSLSLLLGDRNSRCRTMTASAMGPGAPPSPAVQHQTCGAQQQPPQQPIMNGVAAFERVPAHSPSNVPPVEGTKRHPSPIKPTANVSYLILFASEYQTSLCHAPVSGPRQVQRRALFSAIKTSPSRTLSLGPTFS